MIAGTSRFMDAIDGGMWTYGDHFPAADRTAFGGTFCQYPLAMAAALAVLEKIEQEGPALQAALNERTAQIADTLNAFFAEAEAPIKVTWFGSMFRFDSPRTSTCSSITCSKRASTSGNGAPASCPPRIRTRISTASSAR